MKTDVELKTDVQNELRWEESLINDDIAVKVDQGVVTLSGTVDSAQKMQTAENIVREVEEIKDVVNSIQVMPKEKDLSKSTFGEQENLLADTEDKSLKISGA